MSITLSMKRIWQRFCESRKRHTCFKFTVNELGFHAYRESPAASFDIRWDDVIEIRTYKHDLFAIDTICLAFVMTQPDAGIEIWEEDEGYKEVVSAMERRFPIPDDWWRKVAFPAFVTNERVLYSKLSATPNSSMSLPAEL